jgi:copper resistance protein D
VSSLFDDFGFVAVVLQGFAFIAQSVLIGSVAFALYVVSVPTDARAPFDLRARTSRIVRIAAAGVAALTFAAILLTAVTLTSTLALRLRDVAGADFVVAGIVKAGASIAVAFALTGTRRPSPVRRALGIGAVVVLLAAAVVETHAFARLDHVVPLVFATAAHELGAGLWLGGLPCLWLALGDPGRGIARRIGRRYSVVAACGVALIIFGAVVFARFYLGSADAFYGTAYGAMAGVKGVLLAALLLLGLANFRALHGRDADASVVLRVRRFVEIEMAFGFAVLMAAASISSSPASIDVAQERVSLAELAARFAPAMPAVASPDHRALSKVTAPGMVTARRTDADRAWAEYNHHVAGIAVVLIGIAALVQGMRRMSTAAHWPFVLLLLGAFLLLRADPEVWPLGPVGPIESLRDPEVVQHRLFVALTAAFAIFEWRVQRRPRASARLARIFPILTIAGGALLLTHSHAVADVKEQLLIEMTHLPIAVLGVVAGAARWLELSSTQREGRVAGFVWPVALMLVGLILLDYREG